MFSRKNRIVKAAAVVLMGALLMTGCGSGNEGVKTTETKAAGEAGSTDEGQAAGDNSAAAGAEDSNPAGSGVSEGGKTVNIEIEVKDHGVIKAELYPDVAPITVENFLKLVDQGFYDGLTFHRIIPGFMIQGGDPTGTGMGGSDENIKGEFAANGVQNDLSHKRGVLSMARAQDPNSASSQFFIMHQDSPFLDGQYAAFGMVTDGIEVVDSVCDSAVIQDDNGTVYPEDQPVITAIRRAE